MIRMPRLLECPRCGLLIQRGKAPGGVAWHDCERVLELLARADQQVLSMDRAVAQIVTVAARRAEELSGRDLAALVGNVAKLQESLPKEVQGGEASGRLLQFLREDEPEAAPTPAVQGRG
jgi:hypothetical protein